MAFRIGGELEEPRRSRAEKLAPWLRRAIIGFALKFTMGLRPTPEQEESGLDVTDHGEEGYIL